MSKTKRGTFTRGPGRIPAMATLRCADGGLVTYRPATRVVPRDRRLEQKLMRRNAS